MFSLILENEYGNSIELSNNHNYSILEITGLHPPDATISTSDLALYDGAKFTMSKVNMRSIDIQLAINQMAEQNRIALYNVIKTKHYIKLKYKNGVRDVFIDGYVERMPVDYYANPQEVTISILCTEPYFNDAQEIISEISTVINNFIFPFAIEATNKAPISYLDDVLELDVINKGEIETGVIIEIRATGSVVNPAIFNRQTTKYFKLNFTMQTGDLITIDTNSGKKSVTLLRGGIETNIFNSIAKGVTWLQLSPGDNVFTYESDSDTSQNMVIRFVHRYQYEGV